MPLCSHLCYGVATRCKVLVDANEQMPHYHHALPPLAILVSSNHVLSRGTKYVT